MMNGFILFQQNSPIPNVYSDGIFMKQKVGHVLWHKDLVPVRDFGIEVTLGQSRAFASWGVGID